VGNITLGGTGKTPFVILLAELFQGRGIPAAILSRGYKGSFSGPLGLVTDGKNNFMDVRQAGDEPYLLSRRLRGVPVFIGRERSLSGQAAVEKFQARVVILDDGFQHLPLKRDVNILLVDARTPFGNGWLFPRGALREPLDQVKRADAVILTKVDLSDNIEKLKEKLLRWALVVWFCGAVRKSGFGSDPNGPPLEVLRGKHFGFYGNRA
jgi:tetraacyldisaccharide 4'-kinase